MLRTRALPIALLVALILFVFLARKTVAPALPSNSTATSSLEVGSVKAILEDREGNTFVQDVTPGDRAKLPQPIPSLERRVSPPASIGAEAVALVQSRISDAEEILKKDPSSVSGWTELGGLYKIAADYAGAKEAWVYATRLNPRFLVPHANLADLLQSYLKDPLSAEKEWLVVLELDPSYTQGYLGLHSLYRFSLSAKSGEADDVLISGLQKNPRDIDLMIALARYYKETGSKQSAKTYYEKALAEAEARKNSSLAEMLRADIKSLE